KQADVLMLIYLLNDIFSKKTKLANYDFYISRTVHKSSLSAPMHAFIASEVEDLHRAYNLFNVCLRTDISDLYGNTAEGVHAASLGGTWQALIFGFAGVKIRRNELFIKPRMPRSWRKLIFSLEWRESLIKLELTNDLIKIRIFSSKRKSIKIGIFNKIISIRTNKSYRFSKPLLEVKGGEYY
ncbi:MAG: glycoside hydrolase family 65 protein, partial [Candidatus Omnitrophica bacterium]|nr:glycoside hydrolase family 65 protein [Candidatus Omnitrophota bacterium]